MKKIPEHGFVFVCGKENPHNIDATWHEREDGAILAEIVVTHVQEGPASHTRAGQIGQASLEDNGWASEARPE